jgi:serine phosphatase RsbU (regulator of sigma subunit)
LDEASLDQLRHLAHQRTYPAGTVLCHQGAVEDVFYIVVEGQVAITRVQPDGDEQLLAVCRPHEHFGELSLLDDAPRMASCTTMVETTVLEITEGTFRRLMAESPAIARVITGQVVANMRALDRMAIADLQQTNEALRKAYAELQAAQEELVEKERMERELEIAATVQRSLLPAHLPLFPDYQFAAYLEPARQVGGDFYDVIELDHEHVGWLLADVVDKGVHAALFMAVTRTLFRTASRYSLQPSAVALQVHRGMLELSDADMFVTAFYGVLHRPSGRLAYVVAGQERPLLLRAGADVSPLDGGGRFLGMIPDLSLREYEVQLRPGDRLLLFSDGVPDAENGRAEPYGHQRLQTTLARTGSLSPSEQVAEVAKDVDCWFAGEPAVDDIALLLGARLR